MRCAGEDLCRFLQSSPGLTYLCLENLDVTGQVTYADILALLEETHDRLTRFRSHQIAQHGFRTFFENLGYVEATTSMCSFPDDEEEFLEDCVEVKGPFKYIGEAEEWEGVQQKISHLRRDIGISTRDYYPEFDLASYMWIH